MLRFLVIADCFPEPDKAAGYLRFYTLLTLLARKHQVLYCALNSNGSVMQPDETAARLVEAGVTLGEINFPHVLKHWAPDIVLFEFYYQARQDYLGLLQRYCPGARIVVDSVDLHFNRLEARARLTGEPEDVATARDVKERELEAYASADMVIVVSDDEKKLLKSLLPATPVEIIPIVHAIPKYPDHHKRRHGELVFVGGFKHDPNVDAMLYFCQDVMPLITDACPEARLKIIGSNPPEAIHALASSNIEVVGYVPETAPYLESAYISVAPLRYGGGLKGKVGEAMSHGLPVVTTSFGAEGFGLEPGKDLLIGDSAKEFASQVISLLVDTELHSRIARSGYDFIARHYSVPAVEKMLDASLVNLSNLPPRKIPLLRLLTDPFWNFYTRHIKWRLGQ